MIGWNGENASSKHIGGVRDAWIGGHPESAGSQPVMPGNTAGVAKPMNEGERVLTVGDVRKMQRRVHLPHTPLSKKSASDSEEPGGGWLTGYE